MPALPGPPVIVTNVPLAGPRPVCRFSAKVTSVVTPVSLKWSTGTVNVMHVQPSAMSDGHAWRTAGAEDWVRETISATGVAGDSRFVCLGAWRSGAAGSLGALTELELSESVVGAGCALAEQPLATRTTTMILAITGWVSLLSMAAS